MRCPRATEVEAARDGRLAERGAIDRHLKTCADCRAHADRLDALARSLRALPDVPEDELAAQRARHRLLEAYDAVPVACVGRRGRWIAATAALAASVAVICLVAARTPTRPPMMSTVDPIVIDAEHARWSRIDDATTTTVRLDDGDARIHVDHRGVSRRLVVLVPDGELDDVGTTFLVRVREGHTVEIAVKDGRVTFVHGHDAPLLLTGGERWVVHEPVAAASPLPSPSPAPTPPAVAPRCISSAPSARIHEGSAAGSAKAPIDDELRDAISSLDAGDPTGASKKLREIVTHYPSDPRAEDAAYLLAIALQRASDTVGARAAARDYLQRFPNGFRRAAIEPLAR